MLRARLGKKNNSCSGGPALCRLSLAMLPRSLRYRQCLEIPWTPQLESVTLSLALENPATARVFPNKPIGGERRLDGNHSFLSNKNIHEGLETGFHGLDVLSVSILFLVEL